jgi:uncharacterized membrane-anchored protein
MKRTATTACLSLLVPFIALSFPVFAQDAAQEAPAAPAASAEQQIEADFQKASAAAGKVAVKGPAEVALGTHGVIHLPQGYVYVPQPEAGALTRAMGNGSSQSLNGLIAPAGEGDWMAFLEYYGDGHVKDDDAKTWNADELLQTIKSDTEAGNADRQSRGFPPIEVGGWIEPPAYDAAAHRLVWSALVRRKTAAAGEGSANYNTYALGREGHFELNLVTSVDKIEAHKSDAKTLLAALDFNEGQRYADFNPATDKAAAYGLAALVGGVAAKKLGLLAVAAGLFAKFAKLIAIAAVAGMAGLRKFFSRGSGQA